MKRLLPVNVYVYALVAHTRVLKLYEKVCSCKHTISDYLSAQFSCMFRNYKNAVLNYETEDLFFAPHP